MLDFGGHAEDIKKAEELYQFYQKVSSKIASPTVCYNQSNAVYERKSELLNDDSGRIPCDETPQSGTNIGKATKSKALCKLPTTKSVEKSAKKKLESVFEGFEGRLLHEIQQLRNENKELEEKLIITEYERRVQEELLEKMKSVNQKLLQDSGVCFSESVRHRYLVMESNNLNNRKSEILEKLASKESETLNVTSEVDQLKEKTQMLHREREEMVMCASHTTAHLSMMHNECKSLEILKEEQLQRKLILHRLRQRDAGARVILRTKPTNATSCVTFLTEERVLLQGFSNSKAKHKQGMVYNFHRIFKPDDPMTHLFEELGLYVMSTLDGFNSVVIAFGQTGSGKSRTMFGGDEENGVVEYACKELQNERDNRPNWKFNITASVFESSGETMYDILSDNRERVCLKDDGERLILGQEIGLIALNQKEDINVLLETIYRQRKVGHSSKLQTGSSRSHLIVIIRAHGRDCMNEENTVDGTLILCDLAGFEDVDDITEMSHTAAAEALSINDSLKIIGEVLSAKQKRKQRMLFGRSMMTLMMKPCLVGDAACVLILHINADVDDLKSNARTLQLGANVMPSQKKGQKKVKKGIRWSM